MQEVSCMYFLSWSCLVHISKNPGAFDRACVSVLLDHINTPSCRVISLYSCTTNIHLVTWALLPTITVILAQERLWTWKNLLSSIDKNRLCVRESYQYTERKIYALNDVYTGLLLVSVWAFLGFHPGSENMQRNQITTAILWFNIRWHTWLATTSMWRLLLSWAMITAYTPK
jgi:hypothetical protein